MNFTGAIESAEKQYKQILEDFFISCYDEKYLSSHGIDHHRRVWRYSKELLNLIPLKNSDQISQLAAELIITSYLHDIGMSVDPGIKHGKYSRNLCSQFLIRNNLPQNDWLNVLEAIEYHDNKDYTGSTNSIDLLTILSVADDLDAFGFTGIFRYSEIYLTRGIDCQNIGYLIRANAEKRFDNFRKNFSADSEIVQKHSKRYYILDDFFGKYNEQLPSYHFRSESPSGFCGVIEVLTRMIENQMELKEIYLFAKNCIIDPIILWYFSELEKELSSF